MRSMPFNVRSRPSRVGGYGWNEGRIHPTADGGFQERHTPREEPYEHDRRGTLRGGDPAVKRMVRNTEALCMDESCRSNDGAQIVRGRRTHAIRPAGRRHGTAGKSDHHAAAGPIT